MRKSKSDYFENLNEKNINDNKTFWKTIKPFLLDKVTSTKKMILIGKEEIIVGDYNTAKVLNTLCCKIQEPSQHTRYRRSVQQTFKTAIFLFKDK